MAFDHPVIHNRRMRGKGERASGRTTRLALQAGGLILALVVVWALLRTPAGPAVALANTAASAVDGGAQPSTDLLVDDPEVEGWESEAISERIDAQLAKIVRWLEEPARVAVGELENLAAPGFRGAALRPESVGTVFDGEPFRIERAEALESDPGRHQERAGFVAALKELRQPYLANVHAKFKLYRIEVGEASIVTRQYLSIDGRDSEGQVEEHTTWASSWTRTEPPRLENLVIEDYERARTAAAGPLFADTTESILGYPIASDYLLGRDLPYWYQRIEMRFGQSPLGYHGVSLGDVNGDGLEDLYLANPGGLPNRLYVQNPDGTVTESSAAAGVDWMTRTMSSLFVDLDNDGDQDLVVGSTPQIVMENDGSGRFRGRQTLPGNAFATSMAAADADGDGDLDLYICNYSSAGPVPIHDANNGPPNTLWRNDGDWRFTDITDEVGLDQGNSRFSFAAAWEDYDNDGDLDLYVANDYGRNNLYKNDGGRFRDVAGEAGVEDISAGMSVTFGDYDHDGWMDLYVSNMFSSAGNRITYQRQFNPAAGAEDRTEFQRHAKGNSLFKGGPDGRFTDVSVEAGVTMGRWAWASLFVDIDNNGFEDLIIANGNLTNENSKDL